MKAHLPRRRQWCTFGGPLPRATGDRLLATGQQYARCPVCRRRLRVRHIVQCPYMSERALDIDCGDCCTPPCYIRTDLPPHKTRKTLQPARRAACRPQQTTVRVTRRPLR